ncbi:hypothetical protein [Pseudonocardia sp. MH-G8]|uniref:hypothetical protein n=1 Tax=Pseudonocardia sp. MH-G8 TaxID=1854588 RepID=UPI000B9FAC44|nr:hypothetical protein [Pseudonocardia sp. MH-G8]OZM81614.1 hypothetical protein CFP66_16005 [Pseudonocardia sp. MH-G8]
MSTVPDADPTQPVPTVPQAPVRGAREDRAAQKRRFSGIRWGSAFFGWLTATGMAVLLTGLVAGIGAALGLATAPGGPAQAVDQATRDPAAARTVGVAGAVVVLAILLVSYYCGGYVAGRMARFAGAKQGVAVWLWALLVAALVTIAGAVAGVQFDVLGNLGGLPRIPLDGNAVTTAGIAAGVGALVASLVGAVLGGLAGMRYHRKLDRSTAEAGIAPGPGAPA